MPTMNITNLAIRTLYDTVPIQESDNRLTEKIDLKITDRLGLKSIQFIQLVVLSFLCTISYSQDICFDGIYCPFPGDATYPADPTANGCGTGGTDEYGNVDFVLDPGTDVGAGGTCDILQIFIHYEPDGNVYLSFIQANQGQACYSFYFDTDCDATTGSNEDLLDPSDGIVITAQGAEVRFLVCVQGDNVNDPEVETWDGTGWVANGTNNILGLAGFTDGCSGSNEAFVETQIPIDDLLNVCDPTSNCGTLNLTTFLTFAGGSFNSQECDVTFESTQTTVPAQVMADLAVPDPSCTDNVVTFDASGSSGSLSLVYEWDFDGDGTIDQTTMTPTVSTTYTTPGTYTVTVGVSDSDPQCPDAMPDTATVMITICGASAVTCPPTPVDVLEGESIDPTILGEPTVTTSDCNPTFELSVVDTPGPGDCLLGLEEIISRVFTITDACGVSECTQIINVEDINPPMVVADLAQADPVCFGENIVFDASGSTGFTDMVYDWDFDGDGVIDQTTTTPTTTNSYPNPGTYTVSVTVTAPTSPCPLAPETASIDIIICDQIAVTCPIASVSIVDGDPMDPTALGEPTFTTNECNLNPQVSFVDSALPATCPLEEIITRTFTITDNCGDQECVQLIQVEVDNPASINSLPITPNICLGDIITLDASASIGDGLSYCWNVDIGNVGCDYTTAAATHQYAAPGTYDISLVITDQFGCTDQQIVGTVIVSDPSINSLPITPEICLGDIITLDASASTGDALSYCWNVGIGTLGCDYTTAVATHQYAASGTYDINLMITDVFGCTDQQIVGTVIVYDPPVAMLAPAGPACAGTTVTFDASASVGLLSPYEWDFNGDGTIDATTTVPTATFTYPTPGTYTAFVTVVDSRDFCPSSTTSTEVIICGTNAFVCPPAMVTIVDGDPLDTQTLGEPQVTTNICNPTFDITSVDTSVPSTCPFEEIITRTFTITDNCGQNECEQIINVEVNNPADINSLPITPEICLGGIITLDASASIGDGLTYCWNVGIGTIGCDYTTATATHQYAASGTYDITLMITDQFGCIDEQVVGSVIVYEGPVAIATAVFDPCTLEVVYDASGSIDNAAPSDLIYTWDFGDGSTSGTASGTYTFTNCASVGTITLTILDPRVPFPACNSDQLTFSFTTDSEPPVLVCPVPSDINCGEPIPTYNDVSEFLAAGGTATDNCGVLAINQVSLDTIPGLCPYVHSIEIVYEAFDICNNRSTCTQTVNLLPSLPSASIPDDVILSCGDDFSTAATGLPLLSQTDCTRPSTLSIDDEMISGSCPGDVTIERTFTVLDDCGNEQVYVQIISIVNDILPTLEGPPDITIGCLDACDPDGTGGLAVVTDFCMPIDGSINTVTLTYSDEYVGFGGGSTVGGIVGSIVRTFVAIDACGNEGIYVQTISILGDEDTVITCNDKINVSLAPNCEGITPDFLIEAPTDTKYFLSLEDGQFGFSLDPNETFNSIDWSVYIESREPITYTITDFCGNSCWGQVLIEANVVPEFESSCTYEPGFNLDSSGEINDEDVLNLNDMIEIDEDPSRTTDYLGTVTLTDGSCQEAFISGNSKFIYNAAPHGKELDIRYVDVIIYLVNKTDGTLFSYPFPTGAISMESLQDLSLNPGEYDVFIAAADHRAFGEYSISIEVTGCLPTCTAICGGDFPEEFITIAEIMDTLDQDCYATLIGDIIVNETVSGDMCEGILHVITYAGRFSLHGELIKQDIITQAYVEEPIDLRETEILAPLYVELECGADVSPEAILKETGSGIHSYPYYLNLEQIKKDTICLEEVVIHYAVPIDTVQEVVAVDGLWVLLDIVKKEARDSTRCLRRGPNPDIQFQEILLDTNRCNIIVDFSDLVIEACAGSKKVIRDWTIIDWCDNSSQLQLSQTIEVKDLDPPVIKKMDDVIISIDPWTCAGKYKLPIGEHSDSCNTALITESWQLSDGQVKEGYAIDLWLADNPIQVYLTVSDDCGNTTLDTFNIIVEDQIAPVAVCQTNLNVTLTSAMLDVNAGAGKVFAESFDAGSHDSGCGETRIQVKRVTGCCSTQCIDQYECTATDPKTGICTDSTVVGYTTEYADFVKFCCEDVGEIVMVELLITDQAGNSSSCIVDVSVVDKTQSILSCPSITMSCLDDMNDIEDPLATGQFCQSEDRSAILLNETDINGYCGTEELIREWYIDRDEDGEFSSGDPYCKQIITIEEEGSGMDPYTIKWPKHYTGEVVKGQNEECDAAGDLEIIENIDIQLGEVQLCGINTTESYGDPIWCEASCSLIASSVKTDTIFSSDACYKLINRWTVIDWCKWNANGGDIDDDNDSSRDQFIAIEDWAQGECANCPEQGPVNEDAVYFKYADVEEDGYYTFDQVVKVIDDSAPEISVVDSYIVSTSGGATSKNDASACRGAEELTATVIDFCNGIESSAQLVSWNVTVQREEFVIDIKNGVGASMTINSGTGSPGDVHVITWTATDGCGNITEAKTEITFGDDVNPSPICIAGVSSNFSTNQDSIVIWASDVDFGSYDNCTDYSELKWALVEEDQVPIMPGSEGFDDQFGYAIYCADGRTARFVDMWVWDENGNGDFCTASIIVEGACEDEVVDPMDSADPMDPVDSGSSAIIIAGQLQTETGLAIEDVTVKLSASLPEYPKTQSATDQGQYSFDNNPTGYNYAVSPEKDMNHTNGVTTLDLLLIQQHVLGLQILDSPYKIIAADISNDKIVSTRDILEARRLILGVTDRFTNNDSWRFIDSEQNFVAADQPWPFIERLEMINARSHSLAENFIGMKIGDVNNNAAPSEAMLSETRYTSTLELDAKLSQKDSKILQIRSHNAIDIYGLQFTLSRVIGNEVVSIKSASLDISEVNYHTDSDTRFSWHAGDGRALESAIALDIEFKNELTPSQLNQLSMQAGSIPSEAYIGSSLDIWNVSLDIESLQHDLPTVSQNWPNPFNKSTQIEINLPLPADKLTLSIFNPMGQSVWSETKSYPAGRHQIEIDAAILESAGIYHYSIKTETFAVTKQMLLMD